MVALVAGDPAGYCSADEIVEADHPQVIALAVALRDAHRDDAAFARATYEWVRDEISHCGDTGSWRPTLIASEVLRERTGLCYAKSHLLAAVLRSQGVPTGLCYQRLRTDTGDFVLHGMAAVYLDGRWHRQDPRGNRPGVDAQFCLDGERLAWTASSQAGECDYPEVYVTTPPVIVTALTTAARGGPLVLPAHLPGARLS